MTTALALEGLLAVTFWARGYGGRPQDLIAPAVTLVVVLLWSRQSRPRS